MKEISEMKFSFKVSLYSGERVAWARFLVLPLGLTYELILGNSLPLPALQSFHHKMKAFGVPVSSSHLLVSKIMILLF